MPLPTEDQQNDLANWASEGIEQGSHYPGMSYEDGVQATLLWLRGESQENPNGAEGE